MARQRPLLPFQFLGEVREDPSYEYIARLEAAAKRGHVQRSSAKQQHNQARADQAQAGIRVRIDRPVVNFRAFTPQMRAWDIEQAAGNAARRKLGNSKPTNRLEVTLLDTNSQVLGFIDPELTEESLHDKLYTARPELFRPTGRVIFKGLKLFGADNRPWVALPISPAAQSLHEDRRVAREVVAPSTRLSTDHLRDDELHTSLGDITVHDMRKVQAVFDALEAGITPLLPGYIEYGPARVRVEQAQ